MSIYIHDNPALRIRITERLAKARAQAASLRPDDKELRGRLRQQLDDMLAELIGPRQTARRVVEASPHGAADAAARPTISLHPNSKS